MKIKTILSLCVIILATEQTLSQSPLFKFEISTGIGHFKVNSSVKSLFQEENQVNYNPLFTANLFYQLPDPKMKIGVSLSFDEMYWKNYSVKWTGTGYKTRISSSNLKRNNLGVKYIYEIFNSKTFKFYSGGRLGISLYKYYGDTWNDGYSPSGNYVDPVDVLVLREILTYQLILGSKINFTTKIGIYSELGIGNGPTLFNAGLFYNFLKQDAE